MMQQLRHLFWDFDGTLYNSYPLMLDDMMRALEDAHIADQFTREEVLKELKVSVGKAIQLCANRSGADKEAIRVAYHHYQDLQTCYDAYEGLHECLRTLHAQGYRHYLYTHRNQSSIDQLKLDGLWELFSDHVKAGDGFPAKPAPDALLALMERNHLTPDECAMVGDRDIDILAGHNAGMKGILFDPEHFYDGCPADLYAYSMAELSEKLSLR